jgi:hypothetical protein
MREYLRNAGLFVLVLSIVTLMRWALSLFGVPYDKGTDKASIFVATVYASIFYGAFGRRWRGYGIGQAAMQGLLLGFLAQLVVLGSTILSYALGLSTYFNHPLALNQPDAADLALGRPAHPARRPDGQHDPERHRRRARLGARAGPAPRGRPARSVPGGHSLGTKRRSPPVVGPSARRVAPAGGRRYDDLSP